MEWCITKDGTPVIIDSYNDVPDVRREKLPPAAYDWVVDRFCACMKEKLTGGETNRIMRVFQPDAGAPPASDSGASSG